MGAFAEYYQSEHTYIRMEVKAIPRKIEEKFSPVTHQLPRHYLASWDPGPPGYSPGSPRERCDNCTIIGRGPRGYSPVSPR